MLNKYRLPVPNKPSRVYRKRKYGGTRKYKKTIPNRVTLIKRLAEPVRLATGVDGGISVVDSGAGCFTLTSGSGTPNSGTLAGTSQWGGVFTFFLATCIQHPDITALFDRYKIVGVKLNFLYQQNTSDTAGGSCLPIMWSKYDFDDAIPPVSATSVQVSGYAKQRVLNANRNFSMYIKPRITKSAVIASNPPVLDAVTSERACWLNTSQDTVDHLGIKIWVDNWMGSVAEAPKHILTVQPTYYFALKDTQ